MGDMLDRIRCALRTPLVHRSSQVPPINASVLGKKILVIPLGAMNLRSDLGFCVSVQER